MTSRIFLTPEEALKKHLEREQKAIQIRIQKEEKKAGYIGVRAQYRERFAFQIDRVKTGARSHKVHKPLCNILKEHATCEQLKNDPDRLPTSFIKNLIGTIEKCPEVEE